MRKFRFVGHPDNYSRWGKLPIFNMVFDEKSHAEYYGNGAESAWKILENMPDWQEVFEEPIKTLHKDTDLGYYSFEIMKSLISSPKITVSKEVTNSVFISQCIELAKELIKQLDKEP